MLQGWVVVLASFAYLGLLFAIAYFADQRADRGRSVIANPYIYSLSLAPGGCPCMVPFGFFLWRHGIALYNFRRRLH